MSSNTYLPDSPVAPRTLLISSITNAIKCVVTVTTDNEYITGQLVVFNVPFDYGMFQINGLMGQIIDVDETNLIFTVNINTTQFDPFIVPDSGYRVEMPASLSSAGARNTNNYEKLPYHSIDGSAGN